MNSRRWDWPGARRQNKQSAPSKLNMALWEAPVIWGLKEETRDEGSPRNDGDWQLYLQWCISSTGTYTVHSRRCLRFIKMTLLPRDFWGAPRRQLTTNSILVHYSGLAEVTLIWNQREMTWAAHHLTDKHRAEAAIKYTWFSGFKRMVSEFFWGCNSGVLQREMP